MWEASLVPLAEKQKSVMILEKKGPHCVHFGVKFSILNVVLTFFLCFLTKYLSKCPSSTKPPLP